MGDDGYSFVPRPVYDGRRVQRAFERDTIDYNSCIIKHLQNRVLFRDARDRVMPRAHATFAPQVESPQAWADTPETSFCTKHAKTQRNKPRPAPFFVVLYNADGQRLMTGQSSGELVMWNSLTFKFECALQAHNMSVHTMVWTHNSQFLVTGDAEGKIRYFQQSLNKVKEFDGHIIPRTEHTEVNYKPIREVSFNPTDTKFCTASDDGDVKVWDFATCAEERVLRGLGTEVKAAAWHPQGALIASGSRDNKIRLWDPRATDRSCPIEAHNQCVNRLQWNMNGNWLLSCSRDLTIKLWDIRMMKELRRYRGHEAEVSSIAWHPVHENLFCSGDRAGQLHYWLSGNEASQDCVPNAHDSMIWSLGWHPLGHMLTSGSNDQSIKVWSRHRPGDSAEDRYAGEPQRQQYGWKQQGGGQHGGGGGQHGGGGGWQQQQQREQSPQQPKRQREQQQPAQLPGAGSAPRHNPRGFQRGETLGGAAQPPPAAAANDQAQLLQQLLAARPDLAPMLGPAITRLKSLPPEQRAQEVEALVQLVMKQ